MPAKRHDDFGRDISAAFDFGTDVVILGGGPAGCAAALALLRGSRCRVLVVERSDYSAFRIGESLAPSAPGLLRHLGAESVLKHRAHRAAFGTAAAWGNPSLVERNFFFSGQGQGWHLERRSFDRSLARLVERAGGTLWRSARVVGERYGREGWELEVRRQSSGSATQRWVRAQFVIDCSGRESSFAKRQGARPKIFDALTAIAGRVECVSAPRTRRMTIVEAAPWGWWYRVPLRSGYLVVLLTDAEEVRTRKLSQPERWWHLLQQTQHIGSLKSRRGLRERLGVYSAASQILSPLSGPGWLTAGDASLAFDPLAGMGIGYALLCGIEAAQVAHRTLQGNLSAAASYSLSIRRHCDEYLAHRSSAYAAERRWSGEPFWRQRVQNCPDAEVSWHSRGGETFGPG